MSCIVMQAEQGQTLEEHKEDTQSVTGQSNDKDTYIGGASVGDAEKAGWKADSIECMQNSQFYKNRRRKASIYP